MSPDLSQQARGERAQRRVLVVLFERVKEDRPGPRILKQLSELVLEAYRRAGLADTVLFLDRLKEFGFGFATRGGVSIGIEDLEIPAEKAELLSEADARVEAVPAGLQHRPDHVR